MNVVGFRLWLPINVCRATITTVRVSYLRSLVVIRDTNLVISPHRKHDHRLLHLSTQRDLELSQSDLHVSVRTTTRWNINQRYLHLISITAIPPGCLGDRIYFCFSQSWTNPGVGRMKLIRAPSSPSVFSAPSSFSSFSASLPPLWSREEGSHLRTPGLIWDLDFIEIFTITFSGKSQPPRPISCCTMK